MKKLVSAAAIAAFVAGAASADVSVNMNARTRPNLYQSVSSYNKSDEVTKEDTLWDLDGYGSTSDTLKVAGSLGDYAGATAEITLTCGDASTAKVTTIKDYNNKDVKITANTGLKMDNYWGWMKFGDFKLSAGVRDSRVTGQYGNSAVDCSGLLDSDLKKYGVDTAVSGTKVWLYDFNNIAQTNGSNEVSVIGDYQAEVGEGKLGLYAGLVQNPKAAEYDTYTTKDGDKFTQESGYVFEATYKLPKVVGLDFVFKNPYNKAFGCGLYAELLAVDNMNAVLGFTFGTQDGFIKSAFAIDERFAYALSKQAKLTLNAKYESLKYDGADDAETAFQVGTEFSYKINDTFTVALDAKVNMNDLDDNDKSDLGENTFQISPLCQIAAGKNATINTAVHFTTALNANGDDAAAAQLKVQKMKVQIPLNIRIKM